MVKRIHTCLCKGLCNSGPRQCSSLLSGSVINIRTKNNLREEVFIWLTLLYHTVLLMEARVGTHAITLRQELKLRHGGTLLTGLLSLACSTSFLI